MKHMVNHAVFVGIKIIKIEMLYFFQVIIKIEKFTNAKSAILFNVRNALKEFLMQYVIIARRNFTMLFPNK